MVVPTLPLVKALSAEQLLPALAKTLIVMGSPTPVTAAPIISTLVRIAPFVSRSEGCVQEVWLQVYSGAELQLAQWT